MDVPSFSLLCINGILMFYHDNSSSEEHLCSHVLEYTEVGFGLVGSEPTPPLSLGFLWWSLGFEASRYPRGTSCGGELEWTLLSLKTALDGAPS